MTHLKKGRTAEIRKPMDLPLVGWPDTGEGQGRTTIEIRGDSTSVVDWVNGKSWKNQHKETVG